MSKTIIFEIGVSTGYVNCQRTIDYEVDAEDLEDVPEDEWEETVMEELGGNEALHDLMETWCRRKT